jgi:hypothetical protein
MSLENMNFNKFQFGIMIGFDLFQYFDAEIYTVTFLNFPLRLSMEDYY